VKVLARPLFPLYWRSPLVIAAFTGLAVGKASHRVAPRSTAG